MLQVVNWENFQREKTKKLKDILDKTAKRLQNGQPSPKHIDLDMIPLINEWSKIPFSYSVISCSGTPKEHPEKERIYGPIEGFQGNPDAYFFANSFKEHPLFESFKSFLEQDQFIPNLKYRGWENQEGIYTHFMEIKVPEEIIQTKNLTYLEGIWDEVQSKVKEYTLQNRLKKEWSTNPSKN